MCIFRTGGNRKGHQAFLEDEEAKYGNNAKAAIENNIAVTEAALKSLTGSEVADIDGALYSATANEPSPGDNWGPDTVFFSTLVIANGTKTRILVSNSCLGWLISKGLLSLVYYSEGNRKHKEGVKKPIIVKVRSWPYYLIAAHLSFLNAVSEQQY